VALTKSSLQAIKLLKKRNEKKIIYSVENECPHEHDLVTLGLLILKPDPMRLSI